MFWESRDSKLRTLKVQLSENTNLLEKKNAGRFPVNLKSTKVGSLKSEQDY